MTTNSPIFRPFNGEWWEPYYSHRAEGDGACAFDGEPWPCTAEYLSSDAHRWGAYYERMQRHRLLPDFCPEPERPTP